MSAPKKRVEIIPNDRMDEFLGRIPRFTSGYVAGIAFGPIDGRPTNVATVTAVEINGGRFLVTAKHVVDSAPARAGDWSIFSPVHDPSGLVARNVWAAPYIFPISSTDVIWKSVENDVAILRAPPGIRLDFFDGEVSAKKTTKVRQTWDEGLDQDAYRAFVTTGFPVFARKLDGRPAEYGLVSLAGSIAHATKPAENSKPMLNLNIGCQKLREDWKHIPRAALYARQLEFEVEPLAGLSGAPVVVVTENAFHFVGIFSEGSKQLDTGRAVPWDAIKAEFDESLVIGSRPQES